MKRVFILVFTVLLLSVGLISSGFAFYNFSDIHKIDDITTNFINAKFNEINNDYYRIYFFASPYYATGADGFTTDDPLVIADSQNNPYIDATPYLVASKKSFTTQYSGATDKTDKSSKNANIFFPDGTSFYYAAESIDQNTLDNGGNGKDVVTRFGKRDFYGYIRENDNVGITQKDYDYVSVTVKGNISSNILANIVASTEFKDYYGFGPEFVGWTYDKETTKKRTMYGDDRYTILSDWTCIDARGWGTSGTPYAIGNYGCQGEIAQVSSNTSLYYLDNLASSSDSNIAVDGSKINDHIIYLYPVFEAKNYSSDKSIGGVTTPFLKFRINPDNDKTSDTYYTYKQAGEINYSISRYTVGLFQREISSDENSSDTDTLLGINYYTKGMYVDTSGNTRIKSMQLDANPVSGTSGWVTEWSSILTYEDIKSLNLDTGYYNIDVSYKSVSGSSTAVEDSETKRVQELVQKFEDSNLYVKVFGSKKSKDSTGNTYGINWLPVDYDGTSFTGASYVIGFQKIDEYHVTGDNLNGSINDFSASGYKKIFNTDIGNEHTQYYTIDRIYLTEGDEIAVLDENCSSLSDTNYILDAMTDTEITNFNTALKNSSHLSKNPFSSLGKNSIIVDGENTSEGDILLSLNGNKRIKANASGNFSLVFCFELEDGLPTSINIGYRKNDEDYALVILNNKPSDNVFIDYDSLIESNNCLASCETDVYSILDLATPLFAKDKDSSVKSIDSLFTYLGNNKKLVDTATGLEITKDLFENKKFILNRSYVLYITDK